MREKNPLCNTSGLAQESGFLFLYFPMRRLALILLPLAAIMQLPAKDSQKVWAQDNLVAWCIVPFDAKKRGPAERAAMVAKLGIKKVAYDWRGEHVATFEEEIIQYKKHGIKLFGLSSGNQGIVHVIAPELGLTQPGMTIACGDSHTSTH